MANSLAETTPDQLNRHGRGHLVFAHHGGATTITRAAATAPLRLLTPKNPRLPGAAWAFASNFGGGLLAGDQLDLQIDVEPHAAGYLGTQSATKVYRSHNGTISRQTLAARLADHSFLALLPDPVACFANARYQQHQTIHMASSSGLVLLDWFTSGRHQRGERWAASSFRSTNEIWIDNVCIARDILQLPVPARHAFGMDRFNCFATLFLLGQRVESAAKELAAWVNEQPIESQHALPIGASPLAGGIVLRAAATNAHELARFLFPHLSFVSQFLGQCPWERKW